MAAQAFLGQSSVRTISTVPGGITTPSAARKPLIGQPGYIFSNTQRSRMPTLRVAEVSSPTSTSTSTASPAVLPDTPAAFPIAADKLIELAKAAFATQTGVDDDSVLSDDFRFEFPVVSLDRAAYLKAVRGFGLNEAIPDLSPNVYDWRVDPYEPNRTWFTIRTTGTHTGTLRFGRKEYKATGKSVLGAPECCSYVFNADGKVKTFTGGVVMDRRVGNTGGLGALFGILYAIGVSVPKPGTFGFALAVALNKVVTWFSGLFGKKKD